MKSTKQKETAVVRRLSVAFLLLSWFTAMASLILGSVGIARHYTIPRTFVNVPTLSPQSTIDSMLYHVTIIAKMGACVGLSATTLLAPAIIWLAVQSYKGNKFSAFKGTHFPRWVGAAAWLLSSGMIISTAVITLRNKWQLHYDANIPILALCLISGLSLHIAALIVLLRPKADAPRRPSLYLSNMSSTEVFKTKSILSTSHSHSYSSPKSGGSPDSPNVPKLHIEYPARCQSVQRKKVDYFAYLFDDGDERYAPSLIHSESHAGHGGAGAATDGTHTAGSSSPNDRPDFEISVGESPWEIMTPHPLALGPTPSLVSLNMPPMPPRAASRMTTTNDRAATPARPCESPDHFTLDLGSF